MKRFITVFLALALYLGMAALQPTVALAQDPAEAPMVVSTPDVGGGYVPPPFTTDDGDTAPRGRLDTRVPGPLPAAYSLVPQNRTTPVKNQGSYGTCWAFAAIASAESSAKSSGLIAEPDFSEWQLAYYVYESYNGLPAFTKQAGGSVFDLGGNSYKAAALMARGTSPVLENQAPYGGADPSVSYKPSYSLRQWSTLHTPDEWKAALMEKGAIEISYHAPVDYNEQTQYYNANTSAYYCMDTETTPNHAVTLVGWDDNYPAANFTINPGQNGAWLVKNSWGTSWGVDAGSGRGYFWLSYADQSLNAEASAFELTAPAGGEKLYTYDDLGMISATGFGVESAWMKSVFTSATEETLSSVGLFFTADGASYSIYVTRYDAASGQYINAWQSPQNGTVSNAGYQKIPLSSPVNLMANQKFEVIVRLTTPGYTYPIPIERVWSNYSDSATFAPGQSYYSYDGSSWIDGAYAASGSRDVCINAFTVPAVSSPDTTPPSILLKNASNTVLNNGAFCSTAVTVTVSDDHLVGKAATKNNTAIAWPSNNTFSGEGSYKITAEDVTGNVSQCSFTVDTTKPVIAAKTTDGKAVAANSFQKLTATVTVSDTNLSAKAVKKNGVATTWPGGNTFSTDGQYAITATDKAGNMAAFTFTVDKTNPVVSIKTTDGKAVAANSFQKLTATVTVSDTNLSAKAVKKNGVAATWPGDNTFSTDGQYAITAMDKAGNVAAFTFTVDKTKPVVSIKTTDGKAVAANSFQKLTATVTVTDANLSSKTVKKNGAAIAWPSANAFSADGQYAITAADKAGNVSTYTFTVDKTKPVIKAKTSDGKAVAANSFLKLTATVTVTDANLSAKTVKKNGKTVTWPSANAFSTDGQYSVTVTDKAGNISVLTFTMDKTAPKVVVKTSTGKTVPKNGSVSGKVLVSVSDAALSKKTVKKDGKTITWPSGNAFTKKGKYTVTATDKAGNTTVYSFTIK